MTNENWLYRATRQIRFAPDREMVRQELREHLLDRRDAFLARGLPEKEAEEATTAAMGDPDEIAEELGRLHSPWWGYFWTATRWVVWAVLVYTLFFCMVNRGYLGLPELPQPRRVPEAGESYTIQYIEGGPVREIQVLQSWYPEGSVELGGYRFTVPVAYAADLSYDSADGDHVPYFKLVIRLRASTPRFWEPLARNQFLVLGGAATDDRGYRYAWGTEDRHDLLLCDTFHGAPGVTWFEIELDIDGPDDIPAWVDVPMGNYTLRVDLEREVLTR